MKRLGVLGVLATLAIACSGGSESASTGSSEELLTRQDLRQTASHAPPPAVSSRPEDVEVDVAASRGALSVRLPFPELPTRAGLGPELGIEYQMSPSDAGGGFGVGFASNVPSMALSADYGVPFPKVEGAAGDPFAARVVLGASRLVFVGQLREENKPVAVEYRLDAADAPVRVYYYGADTTLSVQSGTLTFRGFLVVYSNGRQEVYSDAPDMSEGDSVKSPDGRSTLFKPTRFPLRYTIGEYRDVISYKYEKKDEDGRVYLKEISFAGGRSKYEFTLAKAPLSNSGTSYAAGFEQHTHYVYTKVTGSFDGAVLHRFYFVYRGSDGSRSQVFSHPECSTLATAEFGASDLPLSANNLLVGVYRFGAGSGDIDAHTLRWPTIRFGYIRWTMDSLRAQTNVRAVDVGDVTGFGSGSGSEFLDANGDGLVDVVGTSEASGAGFALINRGDLQGRALLNGRTDFKVRRGTTGQDVTPSFRESGGSVWLTGDFDGDGVDDLLEAQRDDVAPAQPTKLWLYSGQVGGAVLFAPAGAPVASSIALARWMGGKAQVVDINEDGRADILMTTTDGTTTKWTALVNMSRSDGSGLAFLEYDKTFEAPSMTGVDVSLDNSQNRFVDANGDGLMDFVVIKALGAGEKGLCVYENQGKIRSNVDSRQLWWKDTLLFGDASETSVVCPRGYFVKVDGVGSLSTLNGMWLVDVNGDAFIDLVDVGSRTDKLGVWFGRGREGFHYAGEVPLGVGLAVDPLNRSNTRVTDIDGDGAAEIVVFEHGDGGGTLKIVDFNGRSDKTVTVPSLLTEIAQGKGLEHAVHYTTSTDEYVRDVRQSRADARGTPTSYPLAKRVVVRTGAALPDVTEFRYHSPSIDKVERGLLGFGQVESLAYGSASEETRAARVTYELTGNRPRDRYLGGMERSRETFRPVVTDTLRARLEATYPTSNLTVEDVSQAGATRGEEPLTVDAMYSVQTSAWSLDQEPTVATQSVLKRLMSSKESAYGSDCDGAAYAAKRCVASDATASWAYDACNRVLSQQADVAAVLGPSGTTLPARSQKRVTTYARACTTDALHASTPIVWTRAKRENFFAGGGREVSRTEHDYVGEAPLPSRTVETSMVDTSALPAALADAIAAATTRAWTFTYDVYGNVLDVADDLGAMRHTRYDADGVRIVSEANALHHTHTYVYSAGHVPATELKSPQGQVLTLELDALDRPVRVTSSEGDDTRYTFAESEGASFRSVLVSTTRGGATIDVLHVERADGLPLFVATPNETGGSRIEQLVDYGRRGARIREHVPFFTQSAVASLATTGTVTVSVDACGGGKVACRSFDALDRPTTEVDAAGRHRTKRTYEAWGRREEESDDAGTRAKANVGRDDEVHAVIDESGAVTQLDRDDVGSIRAVRLPGEATARSVLFDARGALVFARLPGGMARVWSRDARARIVREETFDKNLVSGGFVANTFDALDRIVSSSAYSATDPAKPLDTASWTYDVRAGSTLADVGHVVRAASQDALFGRSFEETFSYAADGRLMARTARIAGGGIDRAYTERWAYSQDGIPTSYDDPFGNRFDQDLAASGLAHGTRWVAHGRTSELVGTPTYDARSNATAFKLPASRVVRAVGIDPDTGWLTALRTCIDSPAGECVQDARWVRRGDGRVVSSTQDGVASAFTYTVRGELAASVSGSQAFAFAYTPAGRVARLGDAPTASFVRDDAPLALPENGNYELDAFGRVAAGGAISRVTYDSRGRIRRVDVAGKNILYGYSADGTRVAREVLGAGDVVVYPTPTTRDDGVERQSVVRFGGHRVSVIVNEENVFGLVDDQLGVVQAILGAEGNLVSRWKTTPYGFVQQTTGASPLRSLELVRSFTGQLRDDDTGLVHMGARDYLPELGGFATPDPFFFAHPEECATSPTECDLYSYAGHDPLNFTDEAGTARHMVTTKIMRGLTPRGAAGTRSNLAVRSWYPSRINQSRPLSVGAARVAAGTMSNLDVRSWYKEQLAGLPSRINQSVPLRERAMQAFGLRNQIKLDARALMADRAAAGALPAPRGLDDVVRTAYDRGFRGDQVWEYVLEGATRSNKAVDAALGL